MQQFRVGLVFKDHRRLNHSTLGLRVIKKKKKHLGALELDGEGSFEMGVPVSASIYRNSTSIYRNSAAIYRNSGSNIDESGSAGGKTANAVFKSVSLSRSVRPSTGIQVQNRRTVLNSRATILQQCAAVRI